MKPQVLSATWSEGASPDAIVEAFGEASLTVAVLAALLEDPELREKAVATLRATDTAKHEERVTR